MDSYNNVYERMLKAQNCPILYSKKNRENAASTGNQKRSGSQPQRECYYTVKRQTDVETMPRPNASEVSTTCDGQLIP